MTGRGHFEDLTGLRFGRLTVYERTDDYVTPKGKHEVRWLCICDCGTETKVTTRYLKEGAIKSCGCLRHECRSWLPDNPQSCEFSKRKKSKNNTSGVTGVRWDKRSCKWRARISHKGKSIELGLYSNMEDAIKVRKEAEERLDRERRCESNE